MTFKNFYYKNKSNKSQIFEEVFETYYEKGYFGKLNKTVMKEQQHSWYSKFMLLLQEGDHDCLMNILSNRDNTCTREWFSRIYGEDIVDESRANILEAIKRAVK
jgi:hypothetical protein